MEDSEILQQMKRQITKVYTLSYAKSLNLNYNEEYYERARYELEQLEQKYPHCIQSNSPTYIIGHIMCDRNVINHDVPMLSVKHTYDHAEGQKWLNNFLNKKYQLVLSAKMDGIGVSLCYENGYLVYGALRGNGVAGEDITGFLLTNSVAPIKISLTNKIIIRGELCVPLGQDRAKLSGAIRTKQPQKINNLAFFIYEYYGYEQYNLGLKCLSNYFNIVPYIILDKTIDLSDNILIQQQLKTAYNQQIDPCDFDQDGWVIRINNWNIAQELGFSSRYPKYAFALKFTRFYQTTTIKHIIWNVNRAGKLTPVCSIDPVELDQIILTKVNGFNKRYLEINNLGINSKISVGRVGQSAPQIINVIQSTKFTPIKYCPSCLREIQTKNIDYICNNNTCEQKKIKQIMFFFQQLGIKGLGYKTIQSVGGKSITQVLNFMLQQGQIQNLYQTKIQQQIQKLNPTLVEFLSALAIPQLSTFTIEKTLQKPDKYINNMNIIKTFLQSYPDDLIYLAKVINLVNKQGLYYLLNYNNKLKSKKLYNKICYND